MYFCLVCNEYSLADAIEFDDHICYCPFCDATTDDMMYVDRDGLSEAYTEHEVNYRRCYCEDYPYCGH